MSAAHLLCESTGSTLSPITFTLRFSKSGFSFAMYPSSVVQTGVKSLGCENRIAQLSPIHSWKFTVPCEVSAVKFGASSLMRSMLSSVASFPEARRSGIVGLFVRPLIIQHSGYALPKLGLHSYWTQIFDTLT